MRYMDPESSRLELKKAFPKNDQIVKTLIGFCNQYGGKVVVGVEDDGTICGLSESEVEEALETLDQSIYQATEPPIIPRVYAQRYGQKMILIMEVSAGLHKPYFLKAQGLDKGTYIRLGRSTLRASPEMIRELTWSSRGVDYERTPIYEASPADLDEKQFETFLSKRKNRGGTHATHDLWRAYHLIASEHTRTFPTVAGMLCFGKNPQHYLSEAFVICTHFSGVSGREIIKSVDCTGTIINQFDQALDFLVSRLSVSSHWETSGQRIDTLEIPAIALRESILNALVHRNYHIRAPIKIALYQNRIEIFSPGSFPGPIEPTNLRSGITYLRNPALCKVLREVGYIEKLGSGLITILDSYEAAQLEPPEVLEGENFVKYILPRTPALSTPKTDEERILEFIKLRGEVSISDIQDQLSLSRSTTNRRLQTLISEEKIVREGKTRSIRYRISDR